jgi:integrase
VLHRLGARTIARLGEGWHLDGGGLYLRVEPGGGTRWVFRYQPAGAKSTVYLALGAVSDLTLAEAREQAAECRQQLKEGLDPKLERLRRAEREEAERKRLARADELGAATLESVSRAYHRRLSDAGKWRSAQHDGVWLRSLELHVFPTIGQRAVGEITPRELLAALVPLARSNPETASRVRQRLEAVFDDAVFAELAEQNPAAAVKRKLAEALTRRAPEKLAAMPYARVPAFIRDLHAMENVGTAARLALEFAILTAARTGEVLGAQWPEIDEARRVWIVLAERMKGGEAHTVYLSDRALAIIEAAKPLRDMQPADTPYLFASPQRLGSPLSNMALLAVLERMGYWGKDATRERCTVHGFRSSFSTWANETGAARPDVIEACLAHSEEDRVRASYNRSEFADERRALLATWAEHCTSIAAPAKAAPRSTRLRKVKR